MWVQGFSWNARTFARPKNLFILHQIIKRAWFSLFSWWNSRTTPRYEYLSYRLYSEQSFIIPSVKLEKNLYLLQPLRCSSSTFIINVSTSFRISKRLDLSSDRRSLTAVTSLCDASSSKLCFILLIWQISDDGKNVKIKTTLKSISSSLCRYQHWLVWT